ncbi:MAG: hypothetical protein JRD68_00220 [Deltaproteobacteria bacterium]|nr:hypothetical protein [Deltaproteobacteria bacterium]
MSEPKHTPLPWEIEESQQIINLHKHTLFQITSAYGADNEWSGTGVAVCMLPDEDKTPKNIEMVKANAEFIIRAANNHHALVEALESITEESRDLRWSEKTEEMIMAIGNATEVLARAKEGL